MDALDLRLLGVIHLKKEDFKNVNEPIELPATKATPYNKASLQVMDRYNCPIAKALKRLRVKFDCVTPQYIAFSKDYTDESTRVYINNGKFLDIEKLRQQLLRKEPAFVTVRAF